MTVKKCSLIFMRKVGNRLADLEERYNTLSPKKRAVEINQQLLKDFCVGERQIQKWKKIVSVADTLNEVNFAEKIANEVIPTTLFEIARLPEHKQLEVAKEVVEKKLTTKQTKALVTEILHEPLAPLPKNKFRTIVIDPPWNMNKIPREVRPNQEELDYQTMSIEEIKAIPLRELVYDNCHVYLWTTHKFLPTAFEVFKAWNVNYECLLTWVKNVGFTPYSWMYSTEHILFGRIGNLELLKKGERLDFQGKVREHSRKPDEFYELVKKVSPEPRLDMFSRETREGFEQYGNETTKFNL